MTETDPELRTTCPGCGADVKVARGGTMYAHRQPQAPSPRLSICPSQDHPTLGRCPWGGKPAPTLENRGPLAQLELSGLRRRK